MHAQRSQLVDGVQHLLMKIQRATTPGNTVMKAIGQSLILLHQALIVEAPTALEVAHLTQLSRAMTVSP